MPDSHSSYRLPTWLLAVVSSLLWSSAFAGIKMGLVHTTPLFFAGLRFVLAGMLLVPVAGSPKMYLAELKRAPLLPAKVALFQTVLLYSLFFTSLSMVPGSMGAVVNGMTPLWAALAAHLFLHDDKMSRHMLISLAIGFAGILLLSLTRNPVKGEFGGSELLGIILMVTASFAGVLGNVVVYGSRGSMNSVVLTSSQFILGGATLLLLSRLVEGPMRFPTAPPFWGALLYLALVSATAFGIWFYLLSVRAEKVSVIGIWRFLIPVSGAFLSWLIVPGDDPTRPVILGMLLIAFAIIYFFRFGGKS